MSEAVSDFRDPKKVASGRLGAARRWSDPGNRRIVRLADLSHEEAEVVRALLRLRAARATTTPEAA
jgi:hypothetical protein